MLYYVMSHKEPGLAKRYFDNLANGDGLSRESAQHIVREKLLRDKTSRNHMGIVRRAALVSMGGFPCGSEPLVASECHLEGRGRFHCGVSPDHVNGALVRLLAHQSFCLVA